MSRKPKNRLAQFQAQDFQEDVQRFNIQRFRRFLAALAEVKNHGVGEFTKLPDGSFDVGDRCAELIHVLADAFNLPGDTVFSEFVMSALEQWDREAGEEGLAE